MTDIRWDNLRHIGSLNRELLDQLEARQHHNTEHHTTGDKA